MTQTHISPMFPDDLNDEELNKTLDEIRKAFWTDVHNNNRTVLAPTLSEWGLSEVQRRLLVKWLESSEKTEKFTRKVAMFSLFISLLALLITLFSVKSDSSWERRQLSVLSRIENTLINLK